MSLLLDARKKSQLSQSAQDIDGSRSGLELSLDEIAPSSSAIVDSQPAAHTRSAGQNLFDAKINTPSHARAGINRNLLIALGGTVLLLAAGAGYVWYAISADTRPSARARTPSTPILQPVKAEPSTKPVADTAPNQTVSPVQEASRQPTNSSRASAKKSPRKRGETSMLIEHHQTESIDPLLNDAYHAYLGGKFDLAQQLYQKALRLDGRNTDALLGLAAIAQHQGADSVAAHYYAQVLELDPRDAVANSGMSALTTGSNIESRLKTLLNEQQDSSSLHFALGNHYAEQSRWGEAQQEYFDAYKLSPNNVKLVFNLAVSLDRLGQNELAAQYYQRALELDPKNSSELDHDKISQRIQDLKH